jgi:hypothetical protein
MATEPTSAQQPPAPLDKVEALVGPKPIPRMTFRDLVAKVPRSWYGAELCVGDSIGRAQRAKRITLARNDDGRRVVVIHDHRINE